MHEKRLIKARLDAGTLDAPQVAAEVALQGFANAIAERDPALSAEQAYTKALFEHRDLAAILDG